MKMTTYTLALLGLLLGNPAWADGCPRLISQSPYITHNLQWLGLEACIVGVSRYDRIERPHTGGVLDPDAQMIAALEPDVWLTSDWISEEKVTAITPPGTRALRLKGFGGMDEVEENLRLIGREAGIPDIDARVDAFAAQWRTLAAQVNGNGQRVLLLSSCSGTPYSFGQQRWLSDLFQEAGFVNVETVDTIRHIHPGETIADLNTLINTLEPELLFIFERSQSPQCAFIQPKTALRIIHLDGDKFLQPAPVILDGLKTLTEINW